MTQSSVEILYYNENASSIVASAGRISTTKGNAIEIYEKSCKKTEEENEALIKKILLSGHTSVLEHFYFNLAFNNVSVFVEQFMIEFRLASFTVKSRRYVDFSKMGYVSPDFYLYGEKETELREIYQEHMEYLFDEYNYLLEHGVPKEDARFVLPYSFRSNFYCTVNARELIKIVNEMVWGRGKEYPEIVFLGKLIMNQCQTLAPFLDFGKESYCQENAGLQSPKALQRRNQQESVGREKESVCLLNGPQNPEEMICRAAVLENGTDVGEFEDIKDRVLQKKILRQVLSKSRKRELEQVNFTILFQNISLAGITHLVRHRMQSIIIPRYIDACSFDNYIMPESIVKAGLKERYVSVFLKTKQVSESLRSHGYRKADQVYLLLSGLTVPVMTTMNANELVTFIRLRSCNRAQWEIRDHSISLLELLRKKYPVLFSLYGPTCYMTGLCPEGRMSCGKAEQVKKFFAMKNNQTGAE